MARVPLFPSFLLLLLSALCPLSFAVTVTTISTALPHPNGLTLDAQGYLWVSDSLTNAITQMTTAGVILKTVTFSPPLNRPSALSTDSAGLLYVADSLNNRVVKFNTTGTALQLFNTTNPPLSEPIAVALDRSNNVYIADANNNRIVILHPNGSEASVVSTAPYTLSFPSGLAFDSVGTLFISDWNNGRILKRNSSGSTSVLLTGLSSPQGLAVDFNGNVFLTDDGNSRVLKVSASGAIVQIFNTTNPTLGDPTAVALDGLGNLFVTDFTNGRVLKFGDVAAVAVTTVSSAFTSPRGMVYNPVDGNLYICDGSTLLITKMSLVGVILAHFTFSPALTFPAALAVDSLGFLYVADGSTGDRIVKFARNGTQVAVFTAGGTLNDPLGVFVDSFNYIWVSDFLNNRVVVLSGSTGAVVLSITVTTGLALSGPAAVVVDSAGSAYISDHFNSRIVKRTAAGVISTLYTALYGPEGLLLDAYGNLFIADDSNGRIVKITTAGVLVDIYTPPPSAPLIFPIALALDNSSNLFVADYGDGRIVRFAGVTAMAASSCTTNNALLQLNPVSAADVVEDTVQVGETNAIIAWGPFTTPPSLPPVAASQVFFQFLFPSQSQNFTIEFGLYTAGPSPALVYEGVYAYTIPSPNTPLLISVTAFSASASLTLQPNSSYYLAYWSPANFLSYDQSSTVGEFYYQTPNGLQSSLPGAPFVAFEITLPLELLVCPQGTAPAGVVASASRPMSSSSSAATFAPSSSPRFSSTQRVIVTLGSPRGLVADNTGNVFVSDAATSLIYKVNVAGGSVVSSFNFGLSFPAGMAIDSAGALYVADASNNRIVKFSSSGVQLASWTSGLSDPLDVAIDSANRVWVADFGNNRIVVLSPNGTLLFTLPSNISTPSLSGPDAVAVDAAGNVFISDFDNNRIVKRTPAGVVTTLYTGLDGFEAVAVDYLGNVYLADFSSQQFDQLSSAGVFLQSFINVSVPFQGPVAVAVDTLGNVYGGDYSDGRVIRFPSVFAPQPILPSSTTAPRVSSSSSAVVALTSSVPAPATASLCFLVYGLSGNVDSPWSAATFMSFQYSGVVQTGQGSAVAILSGSGTRTYTNRFGATFTTHFTLSSTTDDLLYLTNGFPVDSGGLTLALSSPIQLPGAGPSTLFSSITLRNTSGFIAEGNSTRIDGTGEAFSSTVPGFMNLSIGASNVNSLAANTGTCQAAITFTNGLRQPTQPTVSNGGLHILYFYFISDGANYSVQTSLTITTSSQFANTPDMLGNPYQSITNITGIRTYTHLPTFATAVSQVRGPVAGTAARFYPYTLLSASPGVYSVNTAPFLDADGLTFAITPSAPIDGNAPGTGTQISQVTIHVTTIANTLTQLSEVAMNRTPLLALQQQSYSFS